MVYDLVTAPALASAINELKGYGVSLFLPVHFWKAHKDSFTYAWTRIKFEKKNAKLIPNQPGLYCFVIRPERAALNEIGYLMYIGEAGHDSNNTLRKRFNSYFHERDKVKRAHIAYLLEQWKDFLHFYHCSVDDANQKNIKRFESELLKTFLPIYNRNDFPAEVAQVIKGLA